MTCRAKNCAEQTSAPSLSLCLAHLDEWQAVKCSWKTEPSTVEQYRRFRRWLRGEAARAT